jgi:hypothetical protein
LYSKAFRQRLYIKPVNYHFNAHLLSSSGTCNKPPESISLSVLCLFFFIKLVLVKWPNGISTSTHQGQIMVKALWNMIKVSCYNLSFNLELGQKTKDFKTHQQTLQWKPQTTLYNELGYGIENVPWGKHVKASIEQRSKLFY